MRNKDGASWDRGKGTWKAGEGELVLFRCSFSPSGDFEIFTLLVPGLWLLSFKGLGFDLLARLVPRLELWIKRALL
nr:hypothetical protein [Tanacetum cinerariifolium]